MRLLRIAASWLLWLTAVVLGLPALAVVHLVTVLGDLADDLWEAQ